MKNQQGAPEALRLADLLGLQAAYHREIASDCDMRAEDTINWGHGEVCCRAAAELRRLHAENERLSGLCDKWNSECDEFREDNQRLAALVEAQQPAPSAAGAEIEGGPPGSGGWEKHAVEMERQRDYYRQRCHTMEEHQNGGVWYWQGDDGDNLESMGNSMLVVIRADQLRSLMQPSPTPQADSQPAPVVDEREAFEWWARPRGLQLRRNEALGHYGNIDTQRCWEGWQARAARAPADSVTAPAGWRVVPENATDAMVFAGCTVDNATHMKIENSILKTKVWAAMIDAAPTPPAQAADSVLEDAARWQELRAQHEDDAAERCCVFAPNDMRECLVPVGSLPGELDAFIDAKIAARKQGANHD